ncbi:DUF2637 domain-containing protein [Kitasatospora sp. NPDC058965]|uniref:DUF2637 domain-containing protein n=1 Tax=Kitasatospora sp. NPDC058965 TaxID=3346682 RepID=UPI00367EC64E
MTVPTIEKANGQTLPRLLPTQPIPTGEPPLDLLDEPLYDPDGDQPEAEDAQPHTGRLVTSLARAAVAMGSVVAGIGFTGSYGTLRDLALRKHFGLFSYAFPIGIDAGIVALQAIDLYLVHKRVRFPLLRWFALGLTLATIAFNAAASGPIARDPLAAAMHGVIPFLYIASVEAARHYIGRRNKLLHGAADLGAPPFKRWLLSPFNTARRSREMVLWNKPYALVVAMAHELQVYEERLRQEHGPDWEKKATPEQLLPFKMAKAGFSVEESLAIPFEEELKTLARTGRMALQRAEAKIQQIQADLQIREAGLQAQTDEMRAQGRLQLAEVQTKAEIDNELQLQTIDLQKKVAERQAELQRLQDQAAAEIDAINDATAQRRFEADLERKNQQLKAEMANKSLEAEAAELSRKFELEAAAHAVRLKELGRLADSEELLTAKKNEQAAAEAGLRAVEARNAAAEGAVTAGQNERDAARIEAETAALRAQTAQDTERALETERRAVEGRARVAEAGARARLGQVDFDVLRIMALFAAADDESTVTVDLIARQLGCSAGTASTRRALAKEHLEEPSSALYQLFRAAYPDPEQDGPAAA